MIEIIEESIFSSWRVKFRGEIEFNPNNIIHASDSIVTALMTALRLPTKFPSFAESENMKPSLRLRGRVGAPEVMS